MIADESPQDKAPDDDEEEFSLDQLGAAYARALSQGNPVSDSPAAEETLRDSDQPEDPDPAIDEIDTDDTSCPVTPESIVESMLFVGTPCDVKLTTRKIAAALRDVSPKEVTQIVKRLNERYQEENAAYRIVNDQGHLKMELIEALESFRQEFFGRNKAAKLSQTAVDVLAVVAYNQPLTRAEIDSIRGKPSGAVLNQLVKRELLYIQPSEKKSVKKRYSTTDKFLDFFRLTDLDDLPQSHEASDYSELTD